MHFMGQQAISRATRSTGRLLVVVSMATWCVKFYGIPMEDLNVYGVHIGQVTNYLAIQVILSTFLVTSHVANWYGDHLSYRGWNITDKVTLTAGFGTATSLVTRLDSVLRTVEEKAGNASESRIALDMLKETRHEVLKLSSFAWSYIYVWHLVVPIVLCLVAFFWKA